MGLEIGGQQAARALSARLGASLAQLGARIASCESCTSGAVADAISWAPGASAWFEVGLVCYSEKAKTQLAGVPVELFATDGVVSVEVAKAMAQGAASRAGCRFGVATTGLAGPGGAQGPCGFLVQGTVCICAWDAELELAVSETFVFAGGRDDVRASATLAAMEMAVGLVESAVDDPSA